MSDQTNNSPDIHNTNVLYTPDFLNRLVSLEKEMRDFRQYRHERNEAYSKVLDEIRLGLYEHDEELRELRSMHKEIINALKGVMGRSGLIAENIIQDDRLTSLENWRRDIKAFIAGAIAICSVVSAGLTYLIMFLKGH